MENYINSAASISPPGSFESADLRLEPPGCETGYFSAIEPDYKNLIDRKYLRRMSRFMKMSVACALKSLEDAGITQPDALLTGTSLGCVADTVEFLQQVNTNAETLLNPTAFMQSTHNTPSGLIALLLNCRNFNITFTQKNTSFESALLQAVMMLASDNYSDILVGGMDEITPESYGLIRETKCFKDHSGDHPLVPGEGAAFFVLSDRKSGSTLARFDGLSIFSGSYSDGVFSDFLQKFLDGNSLVHNDIDLFLTGAHPSDPTSGCFNGLFSPDKILRFKDYCGEYDTSTAFALWLAVSLINSGISGYPEATPGKVLIHNQGSGPGHSLILVSRC